MKNRTNNKLIKLLIIMLLLTKAIIVTNPALATEASPPTRTENQVINTAPQYQNPYPIYVPPIHQKEKSHKVRNIAIGVGLVSVATVGILGALALSALDDTGRHR